MDEIGLLVTGITEDGFLRFEKVGTIDNRLLPGRLVHVQMPNGPISGVIGLNPPHLGGSPEPSPDNLAVDLGARDEHEVRALGIDVLQSITFRKVPRILNGNRLNCRAIDDRVGCYLVLKAYLYATSVALKAQVTFAWSVQEEVGLRGAHALARNHPAFDYVIPIDAFATTDAPNHQKRLAHVPLGKGPVLRMVDHGSIASFRLSRWIQDLARKYELPLQAGATGGETDGVPLQESGAHMVPLAIPMRYLHSLAEMADLRDIAHAETLLKRIIDHGGELNF
jgi:putative aminopeptidase FrvX